MRRWTARIFLLSALSVGIGAISAGAISCDGGQSTLCEPGKEIFCKCRGGFEGTQTCMPDGASFGDCTTPEGDCPAINMSSSSGAGTTAASSGSGSTGDKVLYEACTDGSECASGLCDGFCTVDCASYVECENPGGDVGGDCVRFEGGTKQRCAPYCKNQEECTMFYAAPVACGGAKALDNPSLAFAACAPWGAELDGLPQGTKCDDVAGTITLLGEYVVEGKCGLGLALGDICYFDECIHGCYESAECPDNDCDSNGSTPGCCASAPVCDVQ